MGIVLLDMAMSLDGFAADDSQRSLYPIDQLERAGSLKSLIAATGAVVMGRRAYDAPNRVAKGENDRLSFTFVSEGVDSAVGQAIAAAGEKDVTVIGGPRTFQQ